MCEQGEEALSLTAVNVGMWIIQQEKHATLISTAVAAAIANFMIGLLRRAKGVTPAPRRLKKEQDLDTEA